MNKIRKILSVLLICIMTISLVPSISMALDQQSIQNGSTELFNGHATYLLQQRFDSSLSVPINGSSDNRIFSGWDVDYRGGKAYISGGNAHLQDTSSFEKISMNRKLMSHSGDGLVLETAFSYTSFVDSGFYYEISGNGNTAMKLIVDNGYLCIENSDGTLQKIRVCKADTVYNIKAEFTTSENTVEIWINGINYGTYDYKENTTSIDEIQIGTGIEQVSVIVLNYVYMYVNYAVNETFMATPVGTLPEWWSCEGGSIVAVPGTPYKADPNGLSLPEYGYLSRSFDKIELNESYDEISFVWEMLIPKGGIDGLEINLGNMGFSVSDGKFYLNSNEVYKYTENVWYKIEVRTDGERADVLVNNVERASDIAVSAKKFSIITFSNNSSNTVLLDNIAVKKAFDTTDFADYPTVDEDPESDVNVGMVIYPMWREGIHYGWDFITPYEDRTPYLGYYTGGSTEVADWDNKWLLEHGFNHAIFPFARPDITGAGAQPSFSVRGEALHDGYLNSKYKDQLDFAIMITNPTENKYESGSDFVTNVTPYLVEHYFKNPSYKTIDNKLVIYCYNFGGFAEHMGDTPSSGSYANMHMALTSLDAAAKSLGYDGIMFMADMQSTSSENIDKYITAYPTMGASIYKWHYTWGTDMYTNIVNGIKNDYANSSNVVASIPMGFDRTPWTTATVGIIHPDGVQAMCDAVLQYKGNDDPNIVVFTCWDEWGEGHFFAPSNKYGFDYLNVVRDTFTSLGKKTNEDRPTEDAIRRMGVLYPEGRQILKIKPDRKITSTSNLNGLTSLGKINLSSRRGSSLGNCTASYSNGKYTYTVTGTPATMIFYLSSLGIDSSKVTAIRINGYAENSATMVIYAKTSDTTTVQNTDFRFEGNCDGTSTISDTILIPDHPDKLSGTIEYIRFNPTASTSNGSKIYINEIEFYTGNIGTSVLVDDVEYNMVSEPEIKDNTAYLPAYQFLYSLGAYPIWDKASQTLTVEYRGNVVEFKAGSTTIKVNGKNKTVSHAPYYSLGNLFVSYDNLLDAFGYTAIYNYSAKQIQYYSPSYDAKKNYVPTGYSWNFNIDGFAEGWTASNTYDINIRDGFADITAKTKDPVIQNQEISIPKSNAKYAILKVKKHGTDEAGMFRLYDETTSASGVVYKFNLEASDEVQTIVIDLVNGATINSTYTNTYEGLGDTITKLRIDPMDNYGSVCFDSISILSELPEKLPEITAYGFWSENLFQLNKDKNEYGYSNTVNSAGTTSANTLPITETVDGFENVVKIPINSGAPSGIFSLSKVWYEGSEQEVHELCTDDRIVKISFWYKGFGNCTSLRFENRQGGNRDGEEFAINDVSTSQWKYFEGIIDMSNETPSSRWLSLRAMRNSSSGTGGVYLRDYTLVYLNDTDPVTTLTDDIYAISIPELKEGTTVSDNACVYMVEYNDAGAIIKVTTEAYPRIISILNNENSKNETARYYYYTPSPQCNKFKCFFWDGVKPVVNNLLMER